MKEHFHYKETIATISANDNQHMDITQVMAKASALAGTGPMEAVAGIIAYLQSLSWSMGKFTNIDKIQC